MSMLAVIHSGASLPPTNGRFWHRSLSYVTYLAKLWPRPGFVGSSYTRHSYPRAPVPSGALTIGFQGSFRGWHAT
jgi:hypothetical protein